MNRILYDERKGCWRGERNGDQGSGSVIENAEMLSDRLLYENVMPMFQRYGAIRMKRIS